MEYAQLVVVAVVVEAIWENLKMIWQEGKFNWNMVGSLVIGIGLCVLTGADIFPVVGLNLIIPYIGSVLTGIIVSRGANFVHDLINKLSVKKED